MPRVAFLSYSHDSDDHKAWVLRLATDLRSNGVDVRIDRWHLRPGEEAGPFMSRSVTTSEKVVVICSDAYAAKAEARIGGAGFESSMVTAEIVADQGTAKFIPLLRSNSEGRIPAFLGGRIYIDFRNDGVYDEALTTLLRAIQDLPAIDPPPIGPSPFDDAKPTVASRESRKSDRAVLGGGPTVDEVEELLQNPSRRIQLSRLLWTQGQAAREALAAGDFYSAANQASEASIRAKVDFADSSVAQLLPVLMTMGRWSTKEQIPYAANTIAHLLDIPEPTGTYFEANVYVAAYPALLALYSAGLGALAEERYDNLRAMLFVGVASKRREQPDRPLVEVLHRGAPFAQPVWRLLPGMQKRVTAASDYTLGQLKMIFPDILLPDIRGERLFDRLESLISLAYLDATYDEKHLGWTPLGSYLWRDRGIVGRMRADLERLGAEWPPLRVGFFGGAVERAANALEHLANYMEGVRGQLGVW